MVRHMSVIGFYLSLFFFLLVRTKKRQTNSEGIFLVLKYTPGYRFLFKSLLNFPNSLVINIFKSDGLRWVVVCRCVRIVHSSQENWVDCRSSA